MKRFLLIFLILLTGSVAFGESYYMDEITTVGSTKINIHITCCYCNRLEGTNRVWIKDPAHGSTWDWWYDTLCTYEQFNEYYNEDGL